MKKYIRVAHKAAHILGAAAATSFIFTVIAACVVVVAGVYKDYGILPAAGIASVALYCLAAFVYSVTANPK